MTNYPSTNNAQRQSCEKCVRVGVSERAERVHEGVKRDSSLGLISPPLPPSPRKLPSLERTLHASCPKILHNVNTTPKLCPLEGSGRRIEKKGVSAEILIYH